MDTTKPKSEQQHAAEGRETPKPTPEQAEKDFSLTTQPGAQEPRATSSDSQPNEQGHSAPSSEGQSEAGTPPVPKVSFPRVKSSSVPMDGQFGVVSSNGQLVCDFKRDNGSVSPPPEEKIVGSISSNSEPKTLGGSVSPPPQGKNWIQVAPPSEPPENRTSSTLELSVDHASYPEVYVPEGEQVPPLPPRESPQMDQGSLAPTYSTTMDFSKTGYLENNRMGARSRVEIPLVTPLHLLGDQSDTVDCPFCMRRVETEVKKKASKTTHIWGTICFFTTFLGTAAPYCCNWYSDVEHHCTNCKRKIAHRRYDTKEYEALGTQPELREVSKFEAAEMPKK